MSKIRGSLMLSAAKALNIVVQLVCIRKFLGWVGDDAYSLAIFLAAVTPYALFLDLGLSVGIQRRMTQARVSDDPSDVAKVVRWVLPITVCVVLSGLLLYGLLAILAPLPVKGLSLDFRLILFFGGWTSFVGLALTSIYGAVLSAFERFGDMALATSVTNLSTGILGLIIVSQLRSIQSVVWTIGLCTLAGGLFAFLLATRVAGAPSRAPREIEVFREIRLIGLRGYVQRMSGAVAGTADRLVLGARTGNPANLTNYSLVAKVPEILGDVISTVSQTSLPELTKTFTENRPRMAALLERNVLIVAGLAVSFVLVPSSFGSPIVQIWLHKSIPHAAVVALLIGVYRVTELTLATLSMGHFATGRPHILAPFAIFNAVATVVFTLPSFYLAGLPGVAAMNAVIGILQVVPALVVLRRFASPELPIRRILMRLGALFAIGGAASALGLTISSGRLYQGPPWISVLPMPFLAVATFLVVTRMGLVPIPESIARRFRLRSKSA